jgi:cell wall-associated NlpC family hydrolase
VNRCHRVHALLTLSAVLALLSAGGRANDLDDFVLTQSPMAIPAAGSQLNPINEHFIPPVKIPVDINKHLPDPMEKLIQTHDREKTVAPKVAPQTNASENIAPILILSGELESLPVKETTIHGETPPTTSKPLRAAPLSTSLSTPVSAGIAPPISTPSAPLANHSKKYSITHNSNEGSFNDPIEDLISQTPSSSPADTLEKIAGSEDPDSVLQFITQHLQPLDDQKTSMNLAEKPTSGPETARIRPPSIEVKELDETNPAQSASMWKTVQDVAIGALGLMGVKYKFGGNTPETGLDCSGFVRYVFNQALGISLPRSSREISQVGQHIDGKNLIPGDLVFFNTRSFNFSHVGIYLGDNRFIHSPRTGKDIEIVRLTDRYWSSRFNGGRRILGKVKSSARATQ